MQDGLIVVRVMRTARNRCKRARVSIGCVVLTAKLCALHNEQSGRGGLVGQRIAEQGVRLAALGN
jgi:hypothetical protein